jgi:microcin C transport system substrate-binding protein
VPPEVFTTEYTVPEVKGTDGLRDNLRAAARLLKEAGWVVKDGKLVKDNQPFVFEILLDEPVWERISLPFAQNLQRLGITANVRTVDTAQYKNRVDNFDFDMIVEVWPESESPGNEQREFWGSAAAGQPGSRNFVGIKSHAVDALVDQVIAAPDRAQLVTRVHALDRVLLWGNYVIPHWHYGHDRVAYWDKFGMPAVVPTEGVDIMAWWSDHKKAAQAVPAKNAAQGR